MPNTKLNEKQMQAFGGSIEDQQDKQLKEAWEMLKNAPSNLAGSVGEMFQGDKNVAPPAPPQAPPPGSYFGPMQQEPQAPPPGYTTEEIQKMQKPMLDQQKLEAFLEMQRRAAQPPMEVPKSNNKPLGQVDPRLENLANRERFLKAVQQLKK